MHYQRQSTSTQKQFQLLTMEIGIPFCDINDDKVGLLIGTNFADSLIHGDFQVGDPGDPTALKTVLGWMLVGGDKVITNNSISCNSLLNTTLESLNENVKQFWQIFLWNCTRISI